MRGDRGVLCLVFLSHLTLATSDLKKGGYSLLMETLNAIPTDSITITEDDGYKIQDNNITLPTANISLSDIDMLLPFLIDVEVKLDFNASCLFTIANGKSDTELQLCFAPASDHLMDLSLYSTSLPDGQVDFTLNYSKDWTNITIIVDKTLASLRTNCVIEQDVPLESKEVKDIHIEPDSLLYFGNTYVAGPKFFRGLVKRIMLYSNIDINNLNNYNCNEFGGDFDFEEDIKENPEELRNSLKGDKGEKGEKGSMGEKSAKGMKGEKGDSGESIKGPQGPPGVAGERGPIGPQGLKGIEGSCQCSETVVSSLLKSMDEMIGPPGPRGPPGEEGVEGRPGMTGLTGKPGEQGKDGPKGEKGERGTDGVPGKNGEKGPKGDPGKDGLPGAQGPQGLMGPPGPPGPVYKEIEKAKEIVLPGPQGDMGPIGPPGPRGPQGDKGKTGEPGLRGHKGDKGEMGLEGPQGPQGRKGEIGQTGLDGLPGTHGNHGTPGKDGEKGYKGDKGDIGPAGSPAKLSSILDTEMDPIENAAIVEKLRGLKGDKGAVGDKGDKGNTGPVGPIGLPGKNGNDGTPGERGPQGPQGHHGPEGPRGPKGDQGKPGPPGNVPASAIRVMKGPPGPRGPQGKKGERGQKGDTPKVNVIKVKGEKGDRGDKGDPGTEGKPGPPGSCVQANYTSIPGPPGPLGPPGPPGTSITGPKGEPGGIIAQNTLYSFVDNDTGDPNEDEDVYTATTFIFRTVKALYKRTSSTRLGTLAYILEEKVLVIRVEQGWQHVEMGSLLKKRDVESVTTRISQITSSPISTPMPSPVISTNVLEGNYIRLVALNQPYAGNMLGHRGRTGRSAANQECYNQAQRFGLRGSFVAFLTNKVEDLRSIVKNRRDQNIPVVNFHNEVLFDSWSQMFEVNGARLTKARIYSFDGRNVLIDPTWPTKALWHGSDVDGTRATQAYCDQWQSADSKNYGLASSLPRGDLLAQEMYPCDSKLIVLCVEATSNAHRRRQRHTQSRKSRLPQPQLTHDNRIHL